MRFRLDRLDPLGFTQEYASESKLSRIFRENSLILSLEGIICGAETISDAFVRLAALKLPPDCPDLDWRLEKMRRTFDRNTKNFFGRLGNMGCDIETEFGLIGFS